MRSCRPRTVRQPKPSDGYDDNRSWNRFHRVPDGGKVPRAPWRRRTSDSPRPAGRRWTGGLRRSGTMARRALMTRVVRRRHTATDLTGSTLTPTTTLQAPSGLDVPRRRYARFRPDHRRDVLEMAIPVSPAPSGAATLNDSSAITAYDDEAAVPRTIPLLPGDKTLARRVKFGIANGCTIASLMLGMSAIFLEHARRSPDRCRSAGRLRRLRRPGRRARPEDGCGQPVRCADGLARRHVLVRHGCAGRRLRVDARPGSGRVRSRWPAA